MFRRACFAIAIVSLVSCHDGDDKGSVKDAEDADADGLSDTIFVPPDSSETDGTTNVETDGTVETDGDTTDSDVEDPCSGLGEFGCSCVGNADCLNELCIEGPDGNFCTESCIVECPDGYACLNTSLGGGDPISICVPQHTRLCRPCSVQADCQSPLDPSPAACVGSDDASEGSFCATSCAVVPCPDGYTCDDVQVGEGTAKLCRPVDDTCDCRPAWSALGFETSCEITNEVGTCGGSRTCGDAGLTTCSAKTPATCGITNTFGTCPGIIDCEADGCLGTAPAEEVCNTLDDDCDGETDETGECCTRPEDCSAEYNVAATCEDATTCQGTRRDARCVNALCVSSEPIPDDSACLPTTQAVDCTPALPRFCTGALDQTAPSCDGGCASDAECIEGYHCDGTCVPDVTPGGGCDEDSDCGEGVCADGVCCNEACEGSCRACDVEGSAGTCSNVPAAADLDGECGGVACTGYYFGYEDKTCFLRAPVSAETAACDGDGACQTAEDVCGAAAKGDVASSCHATCQVPRAGTCEGTTPGACDNITGGTQTCGVGACAVTVDACEGGVPKVCEAGAAAAEVCDGVDNDCDGKTDAEDDNLVLAPCEKQAGVCVGSLHTIAMCVGGAWQACGDDIYQTHSANYQAGTETTCETSIVGVGLDNDCDGEVDEDFTYTSPAGTVIQGAAKPCGTGVCASGLTVCGLAGGLICSNDFKITLEVCDGQDNDCDGLNDSLDTNASPLQRVDCEDQDGVCAGAKKPNSLCAAGAWQPCNAGSYTDHNPDYEVTETLCDGADNDCDDAEDEDLQGPLNPVQLGVCAGSRQTCDAALGWVDDYPATFGLPETPTGAFLDENCDGIDGSVTTGIFVVASGGATSGQCTKDTPCTLTRGLAVVTSSRSEVYLSAGTYAGAFALPNFAKLFGGYNAAWVRKSRSEAGHTVTIQGSGQVSGQYIAVQAISVNVELHDLIVRGANVPGGASGYDANGRGFSSYGLYARSSTVVARRCEISGGNGGAGRAGTAGTAASSTRAGTGIKGTDALAFNWGTYDCGRQGGGAAATNSCSGGTPNGGAGGQGGKADSACDCWNPFGGSCSATGGDSGSTAASTPNGHGGAGSGGSPEQIGLDGGAGQTSHGSGGGGATDNRGFLDSFFWLGNSGNPGTLGAQATGGGGGGGSGGSDGGGAFGGDSRGAGGGGGGAGGCRSTIAGTGGSPGGGSFGVFGYQSTFNFDFVTYGKGSGGGGGAGGAGAAGQLGGFGGPGGGGSGRVQPGGKGGNGGDGGNSGAGGGGAGGVAYGLFLFQSTVTNNNANYISGGGGGGAGAGGTGTLSGQNGGGGVAGQSGDSSTCSATGGC